MGDTTQDASLAKNLDSQASGASAERSSSPKDSAGIASLCEQARETFSWWQKESEASQSDDGRPYLWLASLFSNERLQYEAKSAASSLARTLAFADGRRDLVSPSPGWWNQSSDESQSPLDEDFADAALLWSMCGEQQTESLAPLLNEKNLSPELRRLGFRVSALWGELLSDLEGSDKTDDLIQAAVIAHDELSDPKRALALLEKALATEVSPYAVLLKLEILATIGQPDIEVYRQWVNAAEGSIHIEAAARFYLAQQLKTSGRVKESGAELEIFESNLDQGAAATVPLWLSLWVSTQLGQWEHGLKTLALLQQGASPTWSTAIARRCADIHEHRLKSAADASEIRLELWRTDPSSPMVLESILSHEITAASPNKLGEILEQTFRENTFATDSSRRLYQMIHVVQPRFNEFSVEAFRTFDTVREFDAVFLLLICRDMEKRDSARDLLEVLSDSAPINLKAWLLSACALMSCDLGDAQRARGCFAKAAEAQPQSVYVSIGLALAQKSVGESGAYEEALSELTTKLADRELQFDSLSQLVDLVVESRPALAIEYLKKARQIKDDPGVAARLVRLYDENGRIEASITERERLLEAATVKKDKNRLLVELAELQETSGNFEAAWQHYQDASQHASLHKNELHAFQRLSKQLAHKEVYVELLSLELKSCESEERRAEILVETAASKSDLGLADDALLGLKTLLKSEDNSDLAAERIQDVARQHGLWKRCGVILAAAGRLDEALKLWHEGMRVEGESLSLFETFEKHAERSQRWEALNHLYEELIARAESNGSSVFSLNELYGKRASLLSKSLQRPDEAVRCFRKAIELSPRGSAHLYEGLAWVYQGQGAWAEWAAIARERVKHLHEPAEQIAILKDALAESRLSREDKMGLHRSILDVSGEEKSSVDFLVKYFSERKDWKALSKILDEEIGKSPNISLLEHAARIAEEELHNESLSIQYYQKLVELKPDHKRALDGLSRIYETTEKWAEFVEVTRKLTKSVKDKNAKALLFFKCGSVMEAKFGKEDEAIRYYDAAIKTSPVCLPAVHGLRDLYLRRKDWPRVIQTLELEVKLWQDNKEKAGVFSQIGRIYSEKLGKADRGMHYYESALTVDPDCLPANKALFEKYVETKQWERAKPLASALVRKAMRDGDPDTRSDFYLKRGLVCLKTGDTAEAIESTVIALEIRPLNTVALDGFIELARNYPENYDYENTFRELEKIYRKRTNSDAQLARILVAQANARFSQGDLQQGELLLHEAQASASHDLIVVRALVALRQSMRQWDEAAKILKGAIAQKKISKGDQLSLLWDLVNVYANGEMNSAKALETLKRLGRSDPDNPEVAYRSAQELMLQKDFTGAKKSMERVIQLAVQPENTVLPTTLARYYYFLGRVLEALKDDRSAQVNFRRAADYDPSYAPPALALAARSVAGHDLQGAESRLINAAHAALKLGDEHSVVPLQRGLAKILVSKGDSKGAIEAYRGILSVEPHSVADRISLAELYADVDLPKAARTVIAVINHNLKVAPVYRMLATFFTQMGHSARAARVYSAMQLLGYDEEGDQHSFCATVERKSISSISRISEEVRAMCATKEMRSPFGQLFTKASLELSSLFAPPALGDKLVDCKSFGNSMLIELRDQIAACVDLVPEVYVGENVPGLVATLSHPRKICVIDRTLLSESEGCLQYLLGYGFEAIRGGYGLLPSLGRGQRLELVTLMRSLFLPKRERTVHTNEFVETLPIGAHELLEEHQGECQDVNADAWIDGMIVSAQCVGLALCNDLAITARALGLLSGVIEVSRQSGLEGMGVVLCGEDLVRFFVGDEYADVRAALENTAVA